MFISPYYQKTAQTHDKSQVRYVMGSKNCCLSPLSHTYTNTHKSSEGVSIKMCWQSNCTVTVTHSLMAALDCPTKYESAWSQIDRPHKHYAMSKHYVICHHNKKLDQIMDQRIHMLQLIHLVQLAFVKFKLSWFSWCVFTQCWFGGCNSVINKVEDWLCFSDSGGNKAKQKSCAESLHCVTAGSREKREKGDRRGRAGAQQGERGVCLHWPS